MRDPYDVLGVSKTASAADIKSAFRKQAKKLHPDANKHDPKAATRFAELNAAYEILGEDDKRKAFDRGEIDAEGKPRFQGFGGGRGRGGGFGREGGFETFTWGPEGFQQGGGRAGGGGFRGFGGGFEELLKEAFGGAARGGRMGGGFDFEQDERRRPRYRGVAHHHAAGGRHGREEARAAPHRQGGRGQDSARARRGPDHPAQRAGARRPRRPCRRRADHGRGRAASAVHPRGRRPAARACGHALRGGARRQGAGAHARRRGRAGDPPGTNSGRTFRLKGKGFPGKNGTGDLLASVRIMLPEGGDAELEALMKKWRDGKPYDPRKGTG